MIVLSVLASDRTIMISTLLGFILVSAEGVSVLCWSFGVTVETCCLP